MRPPRPDRADPGLWWFWPLVLSPFLLAGVALAVALWLAADDGEG